MKLVINGAQKELVGARTVLGLVEILMLDPRTLVIEHNGCVLRRDQLQDAALADGDRIELVRFVGGG